MVVLAGCSQHHAQQSFFTDTLESATSMVVGHGGRDVGNGDFYLEEEVRVDDDSSKNDLIKALLSPGRYQVHQNVSFEPDIYAVLISRTGHPLTAACFNGQWMRVVEARSIQGKIVIHSDRRMPPYWSRVSRLNEIFRTLWKKGRTQEMRVKETVSVCKNLTDDHAIQSRH